MCIVYKKDQNQIDFFYIFFNTAIDVVNGIRYIFPNIHYDSILFLLSFAGFERQD